MNTAHNVVQLTVYSEEDKPLSTKSKYRWRPSKTLEYKIQPAPKQAL
jgi:hypothetical protein